MTIKHSDHVKNIAGLGQKINFMLDEKQQKENSEETFLCSVLPWCLPAFFTNTLEVVDHMDVHFTMELNMTA